MFKLVCFSFLLMTGFACRAEEAPLILTAEKAVALALRGNRDLMAARFAIRQAEARLKQAGLLPNPEFELGSESDRLLKNEGEYNLTVGFKQRFPITGRLDKEKAVARVDVAMALAEVRNQERLFVGEVMERSREWIVLSDKLKANEETLGIIQKLIDSTEKRLKVAEVSEADVNLSKLEAEKLSLAKAALLNQQEIATTELNGLLGRNPKTPLMLTGFANLELNAGTLATAARQANAKRPDHQLAALGIDRAAAEIILAKSGKWEDWTVGFSYSRSVGKFSSPIGTKTDDLIGISLSIPLPFWNNNNGKVSEAEASRQRNSAELSALELRIKTEAQSAENQMRRQQRILRQYRDVSLKLAETNMGLLQKGYDEGLYPITAVIQAQQQFTELRQSYLESVGDFLKARTAWETATATLLPSR
jgi:cobalt-zinc-cadmium efflux system outer membrane protein